MTTSTASQTSSQSGATVQTSPSPDFLNGKAKIAYPSDCAGLAQYALNLITNDCSQNGLGNVALSATSSGQQDSDSMNYFGYFSHWDVQGYKPYMRYALLGSTGAVTENAGLDHFTSSPSDATLTYLVPCSVQTVENGLTNSGYQMMYNDVECCDNGHRDYILNPRHNRTLTPSDNNVPRR